MELQQNFEEAQPEKNQDLSGEVSVFKNAFDANPVKQVPLHQILNDIKNGKHKSRIEQLRELRKSDRDRYDRKKPKLPGVIFAGAFHYRDSKPENLKSATGIIVADIDNINNVDEVFDSLSRDENVWFAFRSPSGEGIKAGLKAEGIGSYEDNRRFYSSIERYFKETYQIELDQKCKDISRLTFVSYDPDTYVNPEPCYFDIDSWSESSEQTAEYSPPPASGSGKEKYARKVLQSCCDAIRDSKPGNMHSTRLRMSRLAAGFINYLDESEIYTELEAAVRNSSTKNPTNSLKTIRDGMEYGKKAPIEIPDIGPRNQSSDRTDEFKSSKSRQEFEELIDATDDFDKLTEEIVAEIHQSDLSEAWKHRLLKKIAQKAGVPIDTIRNQQAGGAGNNDFSHNEIANRVLAAIGVENCISVQGDLVYIYNGKGVWEIAQDRELKLRIQEELEKAGFPNKITKNTVNSILEVFRNKTFKADHQFNVAEKSINCINGELHWSKDGWILKEHCRENYRTPDIV